MKKSKPVKKLPKAPPNQKVSFENVSAVLNDLQKLIMIVAANISYINNNVEGLIGNKVAVNNTVEELEQRVQELEEQMKKYTAQQEFQKVPDLLDKLGTNTKGLQDEIATLRRRARQGNDTQK